MQVTDLPQENKHYETGHYVNWRHENQATTRRRAEQYLTDFSELVAGQPRTAVEIGCSTGETIGLLAERGVQGWGADTSEAAIEQARAQFPQVGFTVGATPIPDAPVHAALMMHVIGGTALSVSGWQLESVRTEGGAWAQEPQLPSMCRTAALRAMPA